MKSVLLKFFLLLLFLKFIKAIGTTLLPSPPPLQPFNYVEKARASPAPTSGSSLLQDEQPSSSERCLEVIFTVPRSWH